MILIKDYLRQHMPLVISTLLGVGICFTVIFALKQWHSDWQLAHQTQTSSNNMIADNETTTLIAAIPDEHIFGQNIVGPGDMPISNLQLRVTGIVKAETENAKSISKAYISISGQPSKIYQVGDHLPYGVKIYAIADNAVTLETNHHLEKLPLPREKLQFKSRNTEDQ